MVRGKATNSQSKSKTQSEKKSVATSAKIAVCYLRSKKQQASLNNHLESHPVEDAV